MSIGFLDENQYRSYPLRPLSDRRLRSLLVDAHVFYGPDAEFDVERDECVLQSVARQGVDWVFSLFIRRDGLLRFPLVVRVGDGSPVFSSHHAQSTSGWSYVYLTIGHLSEATTYTAPSVMEAPALEDRCVVATDFTVVRSITVANGKKNFSFRTVFRYVSANPGTNFDATRAANPLYDPYALAEVVDQLSPPEVQVLGGSCASTRLDGQTLRLSLVRAGGTGYNCQFVLPTDQTAAGTFRTFMGTPPNGRGDLQLAVGRGVTLENLPATNTVQITATADRPSRQCVRTVADAPASLPEPPA